MMPHDFPPPEIIEALEEQLGLDFIHFTVSLDGVVEGVFGMQKMFKSILAEIENMTGISAGFSPNSDPPKFDGEWYCP
jgi:hypothetical protein